MKMKSKIMLIAWVVAGVAPMAAQAASTKIGVVDFRRCLEESKLGQQERDALLALRKQLAGQVEAAERAFSDLAKEFRNPEHLESLSSEAEEDLRMRYEMLSQEIVQKQNQFYEQMGQAEMRVMQDLTVQITRASQIVAKEKELDYILREEALFYFIPDSDFTKEVITEIDKLFASENGQKAKS